MARHGRVDIAACDKVTPLEFGQWVARYNRAGIYDSDIPDRCTVDRIKRCHYVVCSDLPRSIESARRLGIADIDLVSSDFRECEMPYSEWQWPELPIAVWSFLFRFLQFIGVSFTAESYSEAKKRSIVCARQLSWLAREHGSVLFVGHGALNWLLHKNLRRIGWSGPARVNRGYWALTEYYMERSAIVENV